LITGELLILGAGGHGRVVADAALASSAYSMVAFLDDDDGLSVLNEGWRVLGKISDLGRFRKEFDYVFAALGNADLRLNALSAAARLGFKLTSVVHPSAVVSGFCNIGPGAVVAGGAVINVGCKLDRGCIVNTGATVDHDCVLGEGVHICPGAHLAGNVRVGSRTWFGIGAVAKQGVTIGSGVTVGAGAVVIKDVPDGATVVGNPARLLNKKR
jgi:sugar O-acyltransferase (sialic acid O-acetyltransferase NeuD family)